MHSIRHTPQHSRSNRLRSRLQARRRLLFEPLETRMVLSFMMTGDPSDVPPFDQQQASSQGEHQTSSDSVEESASRFVPGEILVGFDSEIANLFWNRGAEHALEAAGRVVGSAGLNSPKVLFDMPATASHAAQLVTRWMLPNGMAVLDAVSRIASLPGVTYAEPNGLVSITSHADSESPGDPSFTDPDGWPFGLQDHLPQIGAEEAWHISTGGTAQIDGTSFGDAVDRSVIVAVIDTGVDLDHPELDDNLIVAQDANGNRIGNFVATTASNGPSRHDVVGNAKGGTPGKPGGGNSNNPDLSPQDNNGHGTHVAGIIAAEINNLLDQPVRDPDDYNIPAPDSWKGGTVGVAPKAKILPVKVLDAGGGGSWESVAAGISFASTFDLDGDPNTDDGVDIINMSLGGGFSQTVSAAIQTAFDNGILVIAAAGNGNYGESSHPASDENALAVAAVGPNDVRASFSNYGDTVDISAPGVQVNSTYIDMNDSAESGQFVGGFGPLSGTSMATPVVAGVAALIKSVHPEWGPIEIASHLLATTALANATPGNQIDSVNPGYEGKLGAGRVDALAAVDPLVDASSPVVIAVGGVGADGGIISRLEPGDFISVQYSHVMNGSEVVDLNNYQLLYDFDGDGFDAGDEVIALSNLSGAYTAFPGRGVRLRIDQALAAGNYQFTVLSAGISSADSNELDGDYDGVAGGDYSRTFTLQPPSLSTKSVQPFGSMIYQGVVTDRIDSTLPAYIGQGSGGLRSAAEMVFDSDGNLYVSSASTGQVLKYNGANGDFIEAFVKGGDGGLSGPRGLAFGPNGHLYVAGSWSDGVYEFDTDGALVMQLDADGTGQIGFPTGLTFDLDGNLYVSSNATHQVLRYDPNADDFVEFVAAQAGGLVSPQGLIFGPDNNLYVASYSNSNVLRFDGASGAFIDEYVPSGLGGLSAAMGLVFADTDTTSVEMELHVASANTNQVLRYRPDGSGGMVADVYLQANDGGIQNPVGLASDVDHIYASGWTSSNVVQYDGLTRGDVAQADQDEFTLSIDANQTVTVRVTSTAELTVDVSYVDSDGAPVALNATPLPAGQDVIYQALRTPAGDPLPAGTLTVRVQGPDQMTSRPYQVEATLNAVQDAENDVVPQSIDGSVINFSPPGIPEVKRGAVIGSVDRAVDDVGRLYQEAEVGPQTHGFLFPSEDLRGSWDPVAGGFAINATGNPFSPLNTGVVGTIKKVDVFSPQYDGYDTYRFDARAGDKVTIRTWGQNSGGGDVRKALVDLHNANGDDLVAGQNVPGVTSDYQIQSYSIPSDGSYFIHVFSDKKVQGTYTLTVSLETDQPPEPDGLDRYSFVLNSPQVVTMSTSADVVLTLRRDNPTNDLVATSALVGGFSVIETGELEADSYIVEVALSPDSVDETADYVLIVGMGATLERAPNDNPLQAIDITGLNGVLGHAGGTLVGFFTDYSVNNLGPIQAIQQSGSIPIQITDISTFDFNQIDVLMLNESNNNNISAELMDRLPDIEAWVSAGGIAIIHDRRVTDDTGDPQPSPLLIGRADIQLDRDFTNDADINVIDDSTLVTHGPGGVVDDTTLDGGNSSSHGFALAASLSADDVAILSAGPADHVAAFKYTLSAGAVYYSTIPLDFYLGWSNNFGSIYAPNALAYVNSLTTGDEDWYKVTVGAEDKLFQTSTPGDGDGEFLNLLDPHLELYNADGTVMLGVGTEILVAPDGRNEEIILPAGNTYLIRVTSEGGTVGEYVLIDPPLLSEATVGSSDDNEHLAVPILTLGDASVDEAIEGSRDDELAIWNRPVTNSAKVASFRTPDVQSIDHIMSQMVDDNEEETNDCLAEIRSIELVTQLAGD